MGVTDRYEITDILSQDAEGVVFQAEDRETGAEVAIRRFFPFGAEGGGLAAEERQAYAIGVRRLMEISHPALRSVLDGGTDPVDGMPFLVTEWLRGSPLSERLQVRPLSPGSAYALVETAIEASLILSEAFQEEAVWVDTHLQTIILGQPGDERTVTFWISPFRWLADPESRWGLYPLLEMTEVVLGWQGLDVSDASGEGLGAWVNALREAPHRWSLDQARDALHHYRACETGPASLVPPAADAPMPPRDNRPTSVTVMVKPNPWPWVVSAALAVAAAAFFWTQTQGRTQAEPPLATSPVEEKHASPEAPATPPTSRPAPEPTPAMSEVERMNARAAELGAAAGRNRILINSEEVTLTGELLETDASSSGLTIYVRFKSDEIDRPIWAGFRTKDWQGRSRDEFDALIGSQGSFSGTVTSERSHRQQIVLMRAADDFQPVPGTDSP